MSGRGGEGRGRKRKKKVPHFPGVEIYLKISITLIANKAFELFFSFIRKKRNDISHRIPVTGKLDESNNKSQFDKSRIKNPREVPFGQESIQEVQHFEKFLESFCPFTRFIDLLFSPVPQSGCRNASPRLLSATAFP